MTPKNTPPSTTKTAFNCPHCGAFASQHWFQLHGNYNKRNIEPFIPDEIQKQKILLTPSVKTEQQRKNWIERFNNIDEKLVFIEPVETPYYYHYDVGNLFLSQCFACHKNAIWVHQSLVFPPQRIGQEPNADLPDEIIQDFEEARSILNYSPRGAAALLRLSIQKLCAFLGEKGKKIDDDIASLVTKGLNPHVQKSLDIVRVIGNEAVHPGVMDIKDDRDTALMLLKLVNIIAEQTISHPKMINEMYDQLPEDKKKGIENRDKKAV